MYSVVLTAMLTAGTAAAPDWGCWGGCHGCWGGCYGCCGGCYGCYGCCGGCYGCYGCYGCWGGCHGCCGGVVYYYSCCGGCWGCCGGYAQPTYVVPVPEKKPEKKSDKKPEEAAAPNEGTVIVQLPADAQLFVDDQLADLTSATRWFVTPALAMDKDYYYTIRAEATRAGRTLAQSARVVVRAGQVSRVNFDDLTSASAVKVTREAAAAAAHVTVRLPESATLYVDDVACPQRNTAERAFDTPKLLAGRTYHYTLRVELVRDGRTVKEDRRIDMQAGQKVDVDFTSMGSVASR
jgi:uncharacterized protein (TIGR03000 family)